MSSQTMVNSEKLTHVDVRVMDFRRFIRFYAQLGFTLTREDYREREILFRLTSGGFH